jgi:RHO1 GDP-GTP exchange protein 1/2
MYIRWESKATSYAHCGTHVLLFSPEFIEIRHVETGRLHQVIEGSDIRLLYSGRVDGMDDSILVAMRSNNETADGHCEKVVELCETSTLSNPTVSPTGKEALWDQWDMS